MKNAAWFLNRDEAGNADGAPIGLKHDRRPLADLAGGAHPRAQHGGMGRRLVLRVVPRVGDRLWIDQPAEQQQADSHADGNRSEDASRHHRGTY